MSATLRNLDKCKILSSANDLRTFSSEFGFFVIQFPCTEEVNPDEIIDSPPPDLSSVPVTTDPLHDTSDHIPAEDDPMLNRVCNTLFKALSTLTYK